MKFNCPDCGAKYRIDPKNLPEQGVHLRCKKCKNRIFVNRPTTSDIPAELSENTNLASDQDSGVDQDTTPTPTQRAAATGDAEVPELEQVDQYVADNNPEAAAILLLELVTRYALDKDFPRAEQLRDKLYDVAPMAVFEGIRANEIIEAEKSQSIDAMHLELWADLYNNLTSDEASVVYYAMKSVSVKAGQIIYAMGTHNSNLYFLQSGQVNMVHWDNAQDQEIVLKKYKPGEFFNHDAFFSFTMTTATMIAIEDSELTYLEQDSLDKWKDGFASLEPKLSSYCRQGESLYQLTQKRCIELRSYPRFPTSLSAMIQYVDASGNPSRQPLKVALFDISARGIAFELVLNRKENAGQLLGQKLVMRVDYSIADRKHNIQQKGRVVAAHYKPFGLSVIHVQFDDILPHDTMADIEILSSVEPQK